MGIYVYQHHFYKKHRVFKKVPSTLGGSPKFLYYGGVDSDDQGWKVGAVVGSTKYHMEIGRGAFHSVDPVRDDMLGEWDVDW